MKCYSWILVSVSLIGFTAFSQQKTTEHIVSKGETISKIAQQYNVTIKEIYELNPEAKKGIKFKSTLLIPFVTAKTGSSISNETTHVVEAKESPYSIARKYGVTVDELYKSNPSIKDAGLQIGQKIIISGGKEVKTEVPALKPTNNEVVVGSFEGIDYEVLPKQTKYSIAKDYGITVAYLDKANPILQTQDLKVGQKILIPVKKYVPNQEVVIAEAAKIPVKIENKSVVKTDEKIVGAVSGIEYEVLPKDTKYNIAKEHGITVAALDVANPVLQTEELKVGQKIVIPVKKYIPELVVDTKAVEEVKVIKPAIIEKKITAEKTIETIASKQLITPSEIIEHEVLAKQTKYGIAKEYGITVEDLDKANYLFDGQGLRIGQKLIIPSGNLTATIQDKKTLNQNATQEPIIDPTIESKTDALITHVVLAKETKYGIATDFGITVKELEEMNPKIHRKLIVGSVLTIQKSTVVNISSEEKQRNMEIAAAEDKKPGFNYGVEFADGLVSTASDNLGIRYRMGGTTRDGFDCSGLMCVTYAAHDIQLPRTSLEQSRYGTVVEVDNAKKGDLIFFKTRGGSRINHVGMVVEAIDGDVKFIHASNSGVIISSVKESYYAKRVVQVNHVL
ncbi:peptidoglycan endopeptidase [Flavobacterium sp. 7A]|uniref:peptidoglycan endopeptidase n=1 Tax=Flavobacterium sp. 7A TaxID=2940571 RepID=UPI0022270C86|nr:peptidoglycan endopeptidase [Flavobacterium sp. 7A]MCW2118679.1 LysM repeat protein [Flavobacterium sp. 7A]